MAFYENNLHCSLRHCSNRVLLFPVLVPGSQSTKAENLKTKTGRFGLWNTESAIWL
jgi:hypothetical protein